MSGHTIRVIGRPDERKDYQERGNPLQRIAEALKTNDVSTDVLKEELDNFLAGMQASLDGVRETIGEYTLETLELSVEVSASGKVSLFGSGGELSGKGGLKLVLKRKSP